VGLRRNREFSVFSLSFLDAITCGFGACILLFMIINSNVHVRREEALEDLSAEVDRMELKITTGRKNLVQIKEALVKLVEDWATLQAVRSELVSEIRTTSDDVAKVTLDSAQRKEAIERLRAELLSMEQETERLNAASLTPDEAGDRIRGYQEGGGDRQYLTGLRMGGKRVLILVDVSTSMLDRTIVNILRRRNMPVEQQLRAPKWQQAVNTIDWLTTQIEIGTQYQIYAFNNEAWSLVEGTDGQWLTVTTSAELDAAVATLRGMNPRGPSSLQAAFSAARSLQPRPDNIYLLTDGLPTMGEVMPTREGVTAKERLDHFNRAVRDLPGAPINVILLAMEGDPKAAPAYWWLALRTGGSMLAPAEDWP
jgi:hypothetical protein